MDLKQRLLEAKSLVDVEPDRAVRICSEIIDYDPDCQEAHMALFMFGYIMLQSEKTGVAYHIYERCKQLNPEISDIYSNQGMCFEYSNPDRAIQLFKKALEKNPKNLRALANLGLLYLFKGEPGKCIEYSQRALKADPSLRSALHNMGLAKLMLRDWSGWKEYYDTLGVKHREARDYGVPDWEGQKGCTVLVYGEQGVGDEIMFASLLPKIMEDVNVIFDCDARLEDTFRRSFPDIPVYGDRFKTQSRAADHKFGYQCAIGQLPYFYIQKDEDYQGTSYLIPDQSNTELFKSLFADKKGKKIGLAWNGGLPGTKSKERSIDISCYESIIDKDNTYVNLDYKDSGNTSYNMLTYPWATGKGQNIDHLVSLVSQLDCVVTSCTTIVYIAGALGIPCLVLVPSQPGYRYFTEGDAFPWYKSVRLFRQQKNANWKSTIKAAKKKLPDFF